MHRRMLPVAALLGLVGATCAALAATVGAGGPLLATPQQADTLRVGDRRCLSRRPQDCLDEPVPADEPHGAICATCHNLWDQSVPANVTRSCTDVGCHSDVSAVSPFHQTIHPDALTDCLHCHKAHEFRVPESGAECAACHKGGGSLVDWASATPTHGLSAPTEFRHSDHDAVACSQCHGIGEQHGTLEVTSLEDCRSCHHSAPLANDCTQCHETESLAGVPLTVTRSLDIRIGSLDRPLRVLTFDHSDHLDIPCADCHTRGTDLRAAAGADCSSCHAQHHRPESDCSQCHQPPAPGAHTLEAHMGCSGAGCHVSPPEGIRTAPRTRALCLACHTTLADHMPDQVCADCHLLPPTDRPGG